MRLDKRPSGTCHGPVVAAGAVAEMLHDLWADCPIAPHTATVSQVRRSATQRRESHIALLSPIFSPGEGADSEGRERLFHTVLERMQADLSTNLNLATLAAERSYSRAHFLRTFRDSCPTCDEPEGGL
ncbi:MAG: hypothetical protein JWQ49_4030 [Edaphobacter sp.]|nr:hypothetical protein [Edaphobacter sp.]